MLTKRQFLLSIAALSVSSALQAAGGPSGPAVHFQAQGKIGEDSLIPTALPRSLRLSATAVMS